MNTVYFPKDKFFNNVSLKYEGKEVKFPLSIEEENRLYLQYFMNYPLERLGYPEAVRAWIWGK